MYLKRKKTIFYALYCRLMRDEELHGEMQAVNNIKIINLLS